MDICFWVLTLHQHGLGQLLRNKTINFLAVNDYGNNETLVVAIFFVVVSA